MSAVRRCAAGMLLRLLMLPLSIVSGAAWAQAASDVGATLRWPPASSPRWICWADPQGHWTDSDCKRRGDCRAHCTRIGYCRSQPVSTAIERCANGKMPCTPLMLHRRLSRLGCNFDLDAFWVGDDAKPVLASPSDNFAHTAEPLPPGRAPLSWSTPTCRLHERDGIEDEVNNLPGHVQSLNARHAAYAALLARGCNVDPRRMGLDGTYDRVTFYWPDKPTQVDEFGVAKQPLLTIAFVGGETVPPSGSPPVAPVPPVKPLSGEWPACSALAQLRDAKLLALCINENAGGNVRFRFTDPRVESDPPTQRVLLLTTDNDGQPPPAPGPAGPPAPPEPPAPALSVPATVGSVGFGAFLAAFAKWLLSRFAKRSQDGSEAEFAAHETQDVHVSVGFLERPRVRRRSQRRD
ncbi:hypothetical protein [Caballeronia sp. BCC1704]|uniref:hypothetical protein n=1 Tax=Caballeronia sp. BCC1704 TaxID=2676300 RepID=UPI00158ED73E|nr:hypothetical protein [Caballeronia sp. BCC1704]